MIGVDDSILQLPHVHRGKNRKIQRDTGIDT